MGLQVIHMEVRVIWWILQNQKNLRQLTRSGSVLLCESARPQTDISQSQTVRDEHIHMCVKNFSQKPFMCAQNFIVCAFRMGL